MSVAMLILTDLQLIRDAIELGELRDDRGNAIAPGQGAVLNASDIDELVVAYESTLEMLAEPEVTDDDLSEIEIACKRSIMRRRRA